MHPNYINLNIKSNFVFSSFDAYLLYCSYALLLPFNSKDVYNFNSRQWKHITKSFEAILQTVIKMFFPKLVHICILYIFQLRWPRQMVPLHKLFLEQQIINTIKMSQDLKIHRLQGILTAKNFIVRIFYHMVDWVVCLYRINRIISLYNL